MPSSVFTAEGNVSGPSSSTDSGFAQWDGTTGTLLKNHAATIAIGSEVSGLGTNVATALGVAIGSAGAPVVLNGALGTPASGTLTNTTGFPTANLAGAGTGVLTFLATPSSANLAAAVTGETGTGALVFADTPTLVTPELGAATGTSVNLSGNCRAASYNVGATAGASGTGTVISSITVVNGIVTAIAVA